MGEPVYASSDNRLLPQVPFSRKSSYTESKSIETSSKVAIFCSQCGLVDLPFEYATYGNRIGYTFDPASFKLTIIEKCKGNKIELAEYKNKNVSFEIDDLEEVKIHELDDHQEHQIPKRMSQLQNAINKTNRIQIEGLIERQETINYEKSFIVVRNNESKRIRYFKLNYHTHPPSVECVKEKGSTSCCLVS